MEARVAGLEGVVEPAAEVVVAGSGGGGTEEGGDVGGDLWVVEEGKGGV